MRLEHRRERWGAIDMLDDKDFAILDMRYKRVDDCDREMKEADKAHHTLDTRLTVIEHGQRINNWLTAAIASGIIALVIKVFMGS